MLVSFNWLKDFVDIDLSPGELGKILTMAGLELEGLEPVGEPISNIVVGKILAIEPHPGADRLSVCKVDSGSEKLSVVCGATNMKEGDKVPLALPGAMLPGGSIKKTKIRGVESTGMLLAEDELGLTDDHSGIMILNRDLPQGADLYDCLPLEDWVLDLSITPNRPDWASVLGIAREVAAITKKQLKVPEIEFQEKGPPIEELCSLDIKDDQGCPRYSAGIIRGVKIGPSPFWMRYRLHLCGIRSINNIVDVTNYILLELGQPLHSFDLQRVRDHKIIVRRAEQGERFTTLDGETRTLGSETLMICDGKRAVALAGIMGGLNSEIFEGTEDVLLESAFFDPVTIRRGSKRLGLSTEASYRFERGTDIDGVITAQKRALSLMEALAGGEIARGILDNYPSPYRPEPIPLRVERTNRILGTKISCQDMQGYLQDLGMTVEKADEDELKVFPPSFRVDVSREADLIEEVARLEGYENIPVTYPSIRPNDEKELPELVLRDRIRGIMKGAGFSEIITYSFISPESADILEAAEDSELRSFVKIINPLTVDQSVMRTSLVPGMLSTVRTNVFHDEKSLRLFEWGKIFIGRKGEPQPLEKTMLAAVISGAVKEKTWYDNERLSDYYDIKGAAEALLEDLGIEDVSFRRQARFPGYDENDSAAICSGDKVIGKIGKVSYNALKAYEIEKEPVLLFEIDIPALMEYMPDKVTFRPFARFPAVYRDLSIIVGREVEGAAILDIIRNAGKTLVESVKIFDVYQGKNLDPSKKALAFRVCYRSERGTLDGSEVNSLHEKIIEEIRKETGGTLKEG